MSQKIDVNAHLLPLQAADNNVYQQMLGSYCTCIRQILFSQEGELAATCYVSVRLRTANQTGCFYALCLLDQGSFKRCVNF